MIYILSDKPARVIGEILVDIPRPRNKDVTTTAKFNELKKNILNIMDGLG